MESRIIPARLRRQGGGEAAAAAAASMEMREGLLIQLSWLLCSSKCSAARYLWFRSSHRRAACALLPGCVKVLHVGRYQRAKLSRW